MRRSWPGLQGDRNATACALQHAPSTMPALLLCPPTWLTMETATWRQMAARQRDSPRTPASFVYLSRLGGHTQGRGVEGALSFSRTHAHVRAEPGPAPSVLGRHTCKSKSSMQHTWAECGQMGRGSASACVPCAAQAEVQPKQAHQAASAAGCPAQARLAPLPCTRAKEAHLCTASKWGCARTRSAAISRGYAHK